MTATYQLFITAGILVAYCISIGTREIGHSGSWRTVIAIGLVFSTFLGITILFMPESPRWLLRNGRKEEALRSIERVKGVPYGSNDPSAQEMYEEQMGAVSYEMEVGRAGWLDCFNGDNKIRYRTFLGMTLQALQQLTGAN